jgi:transcriptional regulator with XRE-family HTH domain
MNDKLSEILRRYLKASGRSFSQMADETGISRTTLSRFVKGDRDINLANAEVLMSYFGLTVRFDADRFRYTAIRRPGRPRKRPPGPPEDDDLPF